MLLERDAVTLEIIAERDGIDVLFGVGKAVAGVEQFVELAEIGAGQLPIAANSDADIPNQAEVVFVDIEGGQGGRTSAIEISAQEASVVASKTNVDAETRLEDAQLQRGGNHDGVLLHTKALAVGVVGERQVTMREAVQNVGVEFEVFADFILQHYAALETQVGFAFEGCVGVFQVAMIVAGGEANFEIALVVFFC